MTSVTRLTAVYPGTFDPMTLGHEDLMRRAGRLFERLIVAVAAGHHKHTLFTSEERLEIAKELSAKYPNVEVIPFHGLLRDLADLETAHPDTATVTVHAGRDWHHITEAQYKAVARALRAATEPDPRQPGVPSTKGVL